MKCPQCGAEMEPGVMTTESFIGGARWRGDPVDHGGRRSLKAPDTLGNVRFPGYRCSACRLLVLTY